MVLNLNQTFVFHPRMEGCWVDNHNGVYIGQRVMEIAKEHGWDGEVLTPQHEHYCDAWIDAESFLSDKAPPGYYIGSNECGDFGMWKINEEEV